MTGGLILIFASLIAASLFVGITVARRRRASRRSFAMLALIVFAVTYIWSALFEIWINGASILYPASLKHAFGPGEMPSHFLGMALFWYVPAMILAGGAYAHSQRRKKEAMT
jgi:ABC-type dipeptide/oligopeptide/nickel transport system permease component